MSEKFVVTKLRGEDGNAVITVRMPHRLISKLEEIVEKTGRNRSQLIIMALDYALDRLEIEDPEDDLSSCVPKG